MNKQEIFDIVVAHLRQQNAKSILAKPITNVHGAESCAYRGPEGRKCAVGILLSDAEYSDTMEGQNAAQLDKWSCVLPETKKLLQDHKYLLVALQNVHDNYPVEKWEEQFHQVAIVYSLVLMPVK